MARLDEIEMDDYTALFPIACSSLLARICSDAGIGLSISPDKDFMIAENYWTGYTARDFVKRFAEVNGANAMIDRGGRMVFRRPSATLVELSENDYSNVTVAEYTAPAVTGVTIKNSDSDVGASAGTPDEVLTVLENPIAGALDETGKPELAEWLLSVLGEVGDYTPTDAEIWFGWQLEAGDIVTVERDGGRHAFPVFTIRFRIGGGCRAEISATGREHRNDMMETNRETYVFNRQRFEIKKDMTGLMTAVFDEHGQSRIEQQAALIAACVKSADGDASFGWELTATGWSVRANGSEVLRIDSNGLTVNGRGEFTGAIHATSGEFSGEVTCTRLTVNGQAYTPAQVRNNLDGGAYANTNGVYWSGGGGFGANCWGNSYAALCVDARYLRMTDGNGYKHICTIQDVQIGSVMYKIPCVPYE